MDAEYINFHLKNIKFSKGIEVFFTPLPAYVYCNYTIISKTGIFLKLRYE